MLEMRPVGKLCGFRVIRIFGLVTVDLRPPKLAVPTGMRRQLPGGYTCVHATRPSGYQGMEWLRAVLGEASRSYPADVCAGHASSDRGWADWQQTRGSGYCLGSRRAGPEHSCRG